LLYGISFDCITLPLTSTTTTSTTTATPTTTSTTTTAFPGYYTWYLKGTNTFSDPCSAFIPIAPVYTSASTLTDGVTLYTDTGLTTTYSGYDYISNSVSRWAMSAGILSSGTTC
jgi:hypothetical protein